MNKKVNDPADADSSDSSDMENDRTDNSKGGTLKAIPKKEKIEKITSNAIGKNKKEPQNASKLKQQPAGKGAKSAQD